MNTLISTLPDQDEYFTFDYNLDESNPDHINKKFSIALLIYRMRADIIIHKNTENNYELDFKVYFKSDLNDDYLEGQMTLNVIIEDDENCEMSLEDHKTYLGFLDLGDRELYGFYGINDLQDYLVNEYPSNESTMWVNVFKDILMISMHVNLGKKISIEII